MPRSFFRSLNQEPGAAAGGSDTKEVSEKPFEFGPTTPANQEDPFGEPQPSNPGADDSPDPDITEQMTTQDFLPPSVLGSDTKKTITETQEKTDSPALSTFTSCLLYTSPSPRDRG